MFQLLKISFIVFFISGAARAENPILERYRDPRLPEFSFPTLPTDQRYDDPAFIPTNLSSLEHAQSLMDELKFYRKSYAECFQRAHLWAFELRQMMNIQSQKVFLFFTDRYTRRTGFDWWFHVAPFVLVNGTEMVLDPYFFSKPVDLQTWTNYFMKSNTSCWIAGTYQDYEAHQQDQDCILRKVPMYYFTPSSVEDRDKKNLVISDWIESQVYLAHKSLRAWWRQ
jgi:hypothetical protein